MGGRTCPIRVRSPRKGRSCRIREIVTASSRRTSRTRTTRLARRNRSRIAERGSRPMPEVLVEWIPLAVGVALGFVTLSECGPGANLGRIAIGSLGAGMLCSAFAGELRHNVLTAAMAVFADCAAVRLGWVGVQLAM